MPDSDQHQTAETPLPSGAVFHQMDRAVVSDSFIASLSDDGVSRGTIKSIERDNERRAQHHARSDGAG